MMGSEINPLLQKWDTPFGTPPFNIIKAEHFREAISEAIRIAESEIKAVTADTSPPSFANSVETLERAGELLGRTTLLLYNLNSAETSDEIQAVAQEVAPLLTKFSNDITLNPILFERIHKIFESKETLNLNSEQLMLLEKRHLSFLMGGAALAEEHKDRFREITSELATLS